MNESFKKLENFIETISDASGYFSSVTYSSSCELEPEAVKAIYEIRDTDWIKETFPSGFQRNNLTLKEALILAGRNMAFRLSKTKGPILSSYSKSEYQGIYNTVVIIDSIGMSLKDTPTYFLESTQASTVIGKYYTFTRWLIDSMKGVKVIPVSDEYLKTDYTKEINELARILDQPDTEYQLEGLLRYKTDIFHHISRNKSLNDKWKEVLKTNALHGATIASNLKTNSECMDEILPIIQ